MKWPNDVLIDGKKVCGILSERIEQPDGARAVVGMGINIALTQEELPVPNATSLLLAGFEVRSVDVAAGVLRHFERLYRKWRRDADLRVPYQRRCASIGTELRIVVPRPKPSPVGEWASTSSGACSSRRPGECAPSPSAMSSTRVFLAEAVGGRGHPGRFRQGLPALEAEFVTV